MFLSLDKRVFASDNARWEEVEGSEVEIFTLQCYARRTSRGRGWGINGRRLLYFDMNMQRKLE